MGEPASAPLQPAHLDRPISHYREILLMPLIYRTAKNAGALSPDKAVEKLISELRAPADGGKIWHEIKNRLGYLGPVDQDAYQEFLYFHGYIQDFLYGQHGSGKQRETDGPINRTWDLRLFKREDLKYLDVQFSPIFAPYKGQRLLFRLKVERMHLLLAGAGVATLVAEFTVDDPKKAVSLDDGKEWQPLTLGYHLLLREALRRVYPPFFEEDESSKKLKFNRYPVSRRWIAGDDKPSPRADDRCPGCYLEAFQKAQVIPTAPIWRHALHPLKIEGTSDHGPVWSQIVDDRMPSFLFLGSPEAGQFTKADWARLCFAEAPSEDGGLPYSESCLQDFKERQCYDRHWYPSPDCGSCGTRYLFTSYSFAAVGTPDKDNFFEKQIQTHFRRHYFQVGFLNYFQFAALLAMSSWISDAVSQFGADARRDELRDAMRELERRFLVFMQRCWFTNISNQLQAREMYEHWRREIGTDQLFEEVRQQLGDAWQFLDAEAQAVQAEAATRLSGIATLGAVIGLPIAGFALIDEKVFHKFGPGHLLTDSLLLTSVIGVTALLAWGALGLIGKGEGRASRRLSQILRQIGVVGVAAGFYWFWPVIWNMDALWGLVPLAILASGAIWVGRSICCAIRCCLTGWFRGKE